MNICPASLVTQGGYGNGRAFDTLPMRAVDVNVDTVVRLESVTDWEKKWKTPTVGTLNKIQRSLEKADVEFIENDEKSETGGPGVRLKNNLAPPIF